jgi:hypothetical protein
MAHVVERANGRGATIGVRDAEACIQRLSRIVQVVLAEQPRKIQ